MGKSILDLLIKAPSKSYSFNPNSRIGQILYNVTEHHTSNYFLDLANEFQNVKFNEELNAFSFKDNKREYLVVYKEVPKDGLMSMAVFLNTIAKYKNTRNKYKQVFFVTNGYFSIDQINACSKEDISNTIFLHKQSSENTVSDIKDYLEV